MADLSAFAITHRWPAQHTDRLQLYSSPTPDGVKVSIMLEEIGLAYEPHYIDISQNQTWTPEYLWLNPNGKIPAIPAIPAILDPDGPGGEPLALFESGAILVYLAEKSGQLLSADPSTRYQTLQSVMFQMAAIGPMSASSDSSINSRARPMRTSGLCNAMSPNRNGFLVFWRRRWKAATGSWASIRSPMSRPWAGCGI